jgi:hypothetical protein
VRDKLVRKTELATAKLVEVLDELAVMVSALDEEIVGYLSLSFNDETVVPGRTVLLGLGPGGRWCVWAATTVTRSPISTVALLYTRRKNHVKRGTTSS